MKPLIKISLETTNYIVLNGVKRHPSDLCMCSPEVTTGKPARLFYLFITVRTLRRAL